MITRHHPSGSTLLLSILTMAAILAVAIGLSVLILDEVQSSGRLGDSIVSFHAAESGIEEGLWRVQQKRLAGATLESALDSLQDDAAGLPRQTFATTGSAWERSAVGYDQAISIDELERDRSVFFQIFADPSEPAKTPGYLNVEWNQAASSTNAQVEVTLIGWDPSQGFSDKPQKVILQTDTVIDLTSLYVADGKIYDYFQVQFRALAASDESAGDIQGLFIQVFDGTLFGCDDGDVNGPPNGTGPPDGLIDDVCVVKIPNTIRITSVGNHPANSLRSAHQAIEATILWKPPISGLYSFVLFSECRIVKGVPNDPC